MSFDSSFENVDGKIYSFSVSKGNSNKHSLWVSDDHATGFVFPIVRGKQGQYVNWWHDWTTRFFIPSDVRNHIDRVVKLLVFA